MEWLVSIFTSGGFGAVTGLIGGWLAKKEARKMKELEYSFERDQMAHTIAELTLEHSHALAVVDKKIDLAEAEGAIEIESKEADAFIESIKQQGKPSGHVFFDGLLRWVRPAITFWLLWQLYYLQKQLEKLTGGMENLGEDELMTMYLMVVNAIIFLATTATGWWFASRRGQV